jgi:hypothetical protein
MTASSRALLPVRLILFVLQLSERTVVNRQTVPAALMNVPHVHEHGRWGQGRVLPVWEVGWCTHLRWRYEPRSAMTLLT